MEEKTRDTVSVCLSSSSEGAGQFVRHPVVVPVEEEEEEEGKEVTRRRRENQRFISGGRRK